MNSIKTLYGDQALGLNPNIQDVMFRLAYPAETMKIAEDMQKRSQTLFEPFFTKWQTRLATDISNGLDKNLTAEEMVSVTPWITDSEFNEMLDCIDQQFGDSPSDYVLALKVVDMNVYMQTLKGQAFQLLGSMLKHKESKKIITPFTNNGPGPQSGPGKIIMP